MSVDDSRVQWMTYTNEDQWFDHAKKIYCHPGLLLMRKRRTMHVGWHQRFALRRTQSGNKL
jgi:hypothetical protein